MALEDTICPLTSSGGRTCTANPVPITHLLEQHRRATGATAEGVVEADDDLAGAESAIEHVAPRTPPPPSGRAARVNGMTSVASGPCAAMQREVLVEGREGHGRTLRPEHRGGIRVERAHERTSPRVARARSTAVSRIRAWARWMPSKAPSATTEGDSSGGKDGRPRMIRMEQTFRLDGGRRAPSRFRAERRRRRTRARDHRHLPLPPPPPARGGRRGSAADRVAPGASDVSAESSGRSRSQRRLAEPGLAAPRPSATASSSAYGPTRVRTSVGERGAAAERRAQIGGERPDVRALAAADAEREVGEGDGLERDRSEPSPRAARAPPSAPRAPARRGACRRGAAPSTSAAPGGCTPTNARERGLDGGGVERRDRRASRARFRSGPACRS